MTETRDRIRRAIETNPGIHFNDLVRSLDLATGQVQYHVRRLCKSTGIDEHEFNGRTHYFAGTYDEWERDAIALLRRETTPALVVAIYTAEPARPAALAETLDLPRSTLEHHLGNLEDAALLERKRDDDGRVIVELIRPEELVELVDVVDVDPGEKLVDRFQRLVDSLFELE
jgi:predicted transcriptional regulator